MGTGSVGVGSTGAEGEGGIGKIVEESCLGLI